MKTSKKEHLPGCHSVPTEVPEVRFLICEEKCPRLAETKAYGLFLAEKYGWLLEPSSSPTETNSETAEQNQDGNDNTDDGRETKGYA